jgi:hypothetical protein
MCELYRVRNKDARKCTKSLIIMARSLKFFIERHPGELSSSNDQATDCWTIEASFDSRQEEEIFLFLQSVQTYSAVHQIAYSFDTQ